MKARDIMTKKVLAVRHDDRARHAVEIMAANDISGLPVLNDADELVGIITESDLLLIDRTEPPRVKTALYGLWIEPDRMVEEDARRRGLLVEDVMTRRVVSFGPDDSAAEIAKAMAEKHIKRVPIVEGNKIVGLVSRHDIIEALAAGKTLE
jgi:CBS domain-containing protein